MSEINNINTNNYVEFQPKYATSDNNLEMKNQFHTYTSDEQRSKNSTPEQPDPIEDVSFKEYMKVKGKQMKLRNKARMQKIKAKSKEFSKQMKSQAKELAKDIERVAHETEVQIKQKHAEWKEKEAARRAKKAIHRQQRAQERTTEYDSPSGQQSIKVLYCPHCGHNVTAGGKFCPNCGQNY